MTNDSYKCLLKYYCYSSVRLEVVIVNAVARGERGSDFSAGSDCRSAAKAGTLQDISKHNVERSAVGLPGAGNWTALFSEVCRLAEAEKLLPREPHARMNGIF